MRSQICVYSKKMNANKLRKELVSCGFEHCRQNIWTKEIHLVSDLEMKVIDFQNNSQEVDYFLYNTDSFKDHKMAISTIMKNLNLISEYSVRFFAT